MLVCDVSPVAMFILKASREVLPFVVPSKGIGCSLDCGLME